MTLASVLRQPTAQPAPAIADVGVLARLSSPALEGVFARVRVSALSDVDGHPRGRVLAIPGLDRGLAAQLLRGIHASALFPWEGKSFSSTSGAGADHNAARGRGANRVRFLRRALFSYRTYLTESVVDRRPAIAIDYDVPDNPALVRSTYDEIREVSSGLYLGRGMRRRATGSPQLLLWFALDTRFQDQAPQ